MCTSCINVRSALGTALFAILGSQDERRAKGAGLEPARHKPVAPGHSAPRSSPGSDKAAPSQAAAARMSAAGPRCREAASQPELTPHFFAKGNKTSRATGAQSTRSSPSSHTTVERHQHHFLSLGSRKGIKSSSRRPQFRSELNISCYQIFS